MPKLIVWILQCDGLPANYHRAAHSPLAACREQFGRVKRGALKPNEQAPWHKRG